LVADVKVPFIPAKTGIHRNVLDQNQRSLGPCLRGDERLDRRFVMPGFMPASTSCFIPEDVDGRDEPGHDDYKVAGPSPAMTTGKNDRTFALAMTTKLLRRLRAELLVLGFGALRRWPRGNPRRIVDEFLSLGHHLENHAPADIRADHDVGSGELIAHQPGTFSTAFAKTFKVVSKSP
jgi:hypothetical protein